MARYASSHSEQETHIHTNTHVATIIPSPLSGDARCRLVYANDVPLYNLSRCLSHLLQFSFIIRFLSVYAFFFLPILVKPWIDSSCHSTRGLLVCRRYHCLLECIVPLLHEYVLFYKHATYNCFFRSRVVCAIDCNHCIVCAPFSATCQLIFSNENNVKQETQNRIVKRMNENQQ